MGPLLGLIVVGVVLIFGVGLITGSLGPVFDILFTYFPYFVALGIILFILKEIGGFGSRRKMGEGEAGALGAIAGAATAEIADTLGGGGGEPETPDTPTTPPRTPPGGDDSSSSSSDGDTTVTVEGDDISQDQVNQMQQLINAIIQGDLGQDDNGNYIFQGMQQIMGGGLSPGIYQTFLQQIQMTQMNQQMLMQQMMQFMQQNNYQQINNQFMLQFMQQVLDIDVEDGDISVQIEQAINQVDITHIEQSIEQVIQEVNITDITYIEQFMEFLIAIEEGAFQVEGDIIIISAHKDISIDIQTLMTFLNILAVIKYQELKEIIIELVNFSAEISWEVRIEKLIVVYRESGGDSSPNIDLSGTNWEVFLRTLRELQYDQGLKDALLNIFEDKINWNQQYGITTATYSSIQNAINSLPKEDVPVAGQKLVEIIQDNNGSISDEILREFIDYLYNKWPANRSYLKNENYYQNMANDDVSERLEEIIGQIEEQEKIEKHVIQLDEDAKQALQEALEYYYQEEDFIHAVRVISTDLQENNIAQVTQDINEVNQDLGIDITNPDYAREQIEELRQIAQDLEQAVEDLKEADHELEQIESSDIEIEESLQQVEQNEIQMTKQARTVLQEIHDLS